MGTYLLASAAAILLAQPAWADFKLGFASPLTGASASIGAQILNGTSVDWSTSMLGCGGAPAS